MNFAVGAFIFAVVASGATISNDLHANATKQGKLMRREPRKHVSTLQAASNGAKERDLLNEGDGGHADFFWIRRRTRRRSASSEETAEEAMPQIVEETNTLLGGLFQALMPLTNMLFDSLETIYGWTTVTTDWCECCESGTCDSESMIDKGRTMNATSSMDAPNCFNPDVPNSAQCTTCFDEAKTDCTSATEDKGSDLTAGEKEIAVGLCLAHLACEEDEPWTDDICVSWKCTNCRKLPDTYSCPTDDSKAGSSLLHTSYNLSKVAVPHRDMQKAKTMAAVLDRGKESIKARHQSAKLKGIDSVQGKFNKLDTSTQGKCQG